MINLDQEHFPFGDAPATHGQWKEGNAEQNPEGGTKGLAVL